MPAVDADPALFERLVLAVERIADALAADRQPRQATPRKLTIDEAAELLGVSRKTLDRHLADGAARLPGGPVDVSTGTSRSRWVFDAATLDEWWAAACATAEPAKPRPQARAKHRRRHIAAAAHDPTPVDWKALARGG